MTAKIRSIRPQLFDHDNYAGMSRDARRVLIELMCLADDEGRLQGSARYLRSQRYAGDDDLTTAQIEAWIAEVQRARWIQRYVTSDGNTVCQILGWRDFDSPTYQVLDRPKPSRFPSPPIVDASTSDRRSIAEPPPERRRDIDETPPIDRRSVAAPSTPDLDLDLDLDLLSPGAREAPPAAREPPPSPAGVCGEREFLALWSELAAGRGRVQDVLMLSGTDRALLHKLGKPESWWREVLGHVERSQFLRGERVGFIVTPHWLLKDDGAHAVAVHIGQHDDLPPEGTVRTPSAGGGFTPEQLARAAAWCAGWSKGAGTDGHVIAAEPPGPRTVERDRFLVPILSAWAAESATAPWAEPIAAEGAAAFLRAKKMKSEKAGPVELAAMVRRRSDLEAAMREGEKYRRAKPPPPSPAAAPAPTPPKPKRTDETPTQEWRRRRAREDAGMGNEENRARIAALEREISDTKGFVPDDDAA